MEKRPLPPRPPGKPQRRPSAAGSERSGTGEGSSTALARMIEQERSRNKSALVEPPQPPDPPEDEL